VYVHRMICIAFHGPQPPDKPHAAHKNNISTDNFPENLCWKTAAENEADKVSAGTSNRRERNGRAKLTPQQIEEIRTSSEKCAVLGARYGVGHGHISSIRTGARWK